MVLCTFVLWSQLFFLNFTNQLLLTSNFSSAASSPLSGFTELKRVRALLWIWLKGMLWLICVLLRPLTFSISAIRQFYFLSIPVFSGVALLVSCRSFSCTFTTLLFGTKRPYCQPMLALDMPFLIDSLIISF